MLTLKEHIIAEKAKYCSIYSRVQGDALDKDNCKCSSTCSCSDEELTKEEVQQKYASELADFLNAHAYTNS